MLAEPTVRGLLDAVHAAYPAVTYTYAWWRAAWVLPVLHIGGGVLLVGGVWPVVMRMMVGAGLGRAKPVAEAAIVVGASGTAFEEGEATTTGAAGPGETGVQADPAVPTLQTAPLEPPTVAAEEQPKDYAGEFYPTAAHAAEAANAPAAPTER